jgi:hypothetical protein
LSRDNRLSLDCGTIQVGFTQINQAEICFAEIDPGQVGVFENRFAENGIVQICFTQISVVEICSCQVRMAEDGTS